MKANQLLQFSVVAILLLFVEACFANTLEEKRKVIDRTFQVSETTRLEVKNSFGKIHLDTWDDSRIKVKVEIIARGKDSERAQRLLERIDVEISESASLVSLQTRLASNMNNRKDESFEINYTISAPARNPLQIENKFGDTFLARREGPADVRVGYGSLKTEDILGFFDLRLSFGSGNIRKTANSDIEVKYSELTIESGEKMEMEQQFSDVEIDEVGTLELESKYGDVEIGKAATVKADAQFSGFSIGELTGSLFLEASYISDFEIGKLHKTFGTVEIYGKFSSSEINLAEGVKADFQGEFSFADMSASYDAIDVYYQVKDGNRREYKARIGGGDASRKIIVKSSYGDLRLK